MHWKWVADGMKWTKVLLRLIPSVHGFMTPDALEQYLVSRCTVSSVLVLDSHRRDESLPFHWNILSQTGRIMKFTDITIRNCDNITIGDALSPVGLLPTLCQLDQICNVGNLVSLCLVNCPLHLPPLVNLPSVKKLHLEGWYVGYISSIHASQLEILTLVGRVTYGDVIKLIVQSGCQLRSLVLGTRGRRYTNMTTLPSVFECVDAFQGLECLTILHPLVCRYTVEDLVGKLPSLRVLTLKLTQPDRYDFNIGVMQEIERCIDRDPARYCALEMVEIIANPYDYDNAVTLFEVWNMVHVVRNTLGVAGIVEYPYLPLRCVNRKTFHSYPVNRL